MVFVLSWTINGDIHGFFRKILGVYIGSGVFFLDCVKGPKSFISVFFGPKNFCGGLIYRLIWWCLKYFFQVHFRYLKRPSNHPNKVIIFKRFINNWTSSPTFLLINWHMEFYWRFFHFRFFRLSNNPSCFFRAHKCRLRLSSFDGFITFHFLALNQDLGGADRPLAAVLAAKFISFWNVLFYGFLLRSVLGKQLLLFLL